jgi:hypothetical protein
MYGRGRELRLKGWLDWSFCFSCCLSRFSSCSFFSLATFFRVLASLTRDSSATTNKGLGTSGSITFAAAAPIYTITHTINKHKHAKENEPASNKAALDRLGLTTGSIEPSGDSRLNYEILFIRT